MSKIMARPTRHTAPRTAVDTQSICLSRMIARFHQILIIPDSETEALLCASSSERAKLGVNIQHARRLLAELERDAQILSVQSLKHETKADFEQKRQTINDYSDRLLELNNFTGYQDHSPVEDLLEVYNLNEPIYQEESCPQSGPNRQLDSVPQPLEEHMVTSYTPPVDPKAPVDNNNLTAELDSSLRSRFKSDCSELLKPLSSTTGVNISTSTESLLTHNRTEQENLTTSLLQMATILKSSSQAFSSAMDEEKDILSNTILGLSKNEQGIEIAQKRLSLLRTMTEGKGWWGRILLYAWILMLAIGSIFVAFYTPKLRF